MKKATLTIALTLAGFGAQAERVQTPVSFAEYGDELLSSVVFDHAERAYFANAEISVSVGGLQTIYIALEFIGEGKACDMSDYPREVEGDSKSRVRDYAYKVNGQKVMFWEFCDSYPSNQTAISAVPQTPAGRAFLLKQFKKSKSLKRYL